MTAFAETSDLPLPTICS